MRRVRSIHAMRAAASGIGVSFVLLVVSLYFIGREVWVARVFENMPSAGHVTAVLRFFASAFITTDAAVQALTLLSAIAVLWLLRELVRLLSLQSARYA
jgi:hypothetical protein